jgi:hypothetical protein
LARPLIHREGSCSPMSPPGTANGAVVMELLLRLRKRVEGEHAGVSLTVR